MSSNNVQFLDSSIQINSKIPINDSFDISICAKLITFNLMPDDYHCSLGQLANDNHHLVILTSCLLLQYFHFLCEMMCLAVCRARVNLQHLYYKKPRTAIAIEYGTAIPNNKERCIDQCNGSFLQLK